ncbi:MAG: sarcosine oxidase [Alphaproteobacteria bacterium]
MAGVDPTAYRRRSPVWRELAGLGAEFEEVAGGACALRYGAEEAAETERAGMLGLCDLSALPRHGFKGWSALEWARSCGAAIEAENNRATAQDDGTTIARLADNEILLLGDLDGRAAVAERLMVVWSKTKPEGVYPVPRADTNCWFALAGVHAAAMFAKLCGVDFRAQRFAPGAVAQTSVARLNAIVVRGDLGTTPLYHLLTDFASARYMFSCLVDAMAEFDGAPVGLAALRGLCERNFE